MDAGEGGALEGASRAVRIEHDSLGAIQVPADVLWQAQTQRAVENFPCRVATSKAA